jgi:hypothetical protein
VAFDLNPHPLEAGAGQWIAASGIMPRLSAAVNRLLGIRRPELNDDTRQYLVILNLHTYDAQRLMNLVPRYKDALSALSVEPFEQVFRSVNGDIFGYLIRSRSKAHQIKANIESPGQSYLSAGNPTTFPFLTGKDALLVLELADDKAASQHFSRALTWLQRH